MTRRAGASRLLCSLLLFVLFTAGVTPFNWDLPEPRSRTSKIRVHPRGNLWATGHFMGKKSLEPGSLSLVGTAPPNTQRDQSLQLSHDLLRILLLKKALGMNLSDPASPIQMPVIIPSPHQVVTTKIPSRTGMVYLPAVLTLQRLRQKAGLRPGVWEKQSI